MSNIRWRDCSPKSGGGSVNYEVMVSDVSTSGGYEGRGIQFYFRNIALDFIEGEAFFYSRISEIMPNSERIYFDFMPNDFASKKKGRKLARGKNVITLTIPYKNKTEKEVVSGYWQGEYRLKFDKTEQACYIEQPERRWTK